MSMINISSGLQWVGREIVNTNKKEGKSEEAGPAREQIPSNRDTFRREDDA